MGCNCRSNNCCCNRYGCGSLVLDSVMVVATGGFWLIWIFAREMRKRH